jgi:hypothetical protein
MTENYDFNKETLNRVHRIQGGLFSPYIQETLPPEHGPGRREQLRGLIDINNPAIT